MKSQWVKTKIPGIRYRLHPSRKHGVQPDRYYTLTYWHDGKTKTEALGWSSEGMTLDKAIETMAELKANRRTGSGPATLAERKRLADEAKQAEIDRQKAEAEAAAIEKKESIPLSDFFQEQYIPYARDNKKSRSVDTEEHLFKNWIKPAIGQKPLKDISVFDCERIKKRMRDKGKSERTVEYALAVLRQVFNFAMKVKLFAGPNPLLEVTKPKYDNQKQRFLTPEETEKLFAELKRKSLPLYRMALISLHAGLRGGEIFALTWGDLDFGRSLILLRDTKNTETRYAFMTATLKAELETMKPGKPVELVFKDKFGQRIKSISATFDRAVAKLGFNDGITDRRMKFTFHNLRHSFASNLVSMGTDLYRVQLLLGHKTQKMTQRYSHMRPDDLRAAINKLDDFMKKSETGQVVSIKEAEIE